MITMRQRAGAACFAVALLLSGLTGCRAAETWNGSGADRTEAETAKENQDENSEETEEAGTKAEQSRGMIFGDQIQELLPQQTQLITDYMETYYSGLASLTPQDMSAFFAEEAEDQLLLNECALEYAVGLRSMQQSDLTLADYRYEMEVMSVEEGDNGLTRVFLEETSTQNFSQHPDIDTELYNIMHYFQLREGRDGWEITGHIQWDSIYWNLVGEYWDWDSQTVNFPDGETFLSHRVADLLEEAGREAELRNEETPWEPKTCTHPYDREAAVAYSSQWVGKRNEEWDDFSGSGGNCQNFVSQCLYAGGIPMDFQGDEQWMWRNDGTYSASWVGVDPFYYYADANQGEGLAASADVSYYEGEEGDLIRMGSPEDWNHVVIISYVVRDEQGNTIDYLINSNTSDVKNFPVGAYPNPCQRLMKIYGWN